MKFDLPSQVSTALNILAAAGYEGYIIGGCVRDYILGKTPRDFDIATNALPVEMEKLFSEYPLVKTGIQHGTVTVIIDSLPLEITTYRCEGEYIDKRRPQNVSFISSLREDCARRDFTINAIAYNETEGLIDYYYGLEDIAAKTIRAVGGANQRFREDALRIVRAIRFASELGFLIEDQTKEAIIRHKGLLNYISMERVYSELVKLVCGSDAHKTLLEYLDVVAVFLPELKTLKGFDQYNPFHIYDVLAHTAMVVDNIAPLPHLRLAALLHDIAKPLTFSLDKKGIGHFYGHCELGSQMAKEILQRLKADNWTIERVALLIKYHDVHLDEEPKIIKRWMSKLTPVVFNEMLQLKRADRLAKNPRFSAERLEQLARIEQISKQILQDQECFQLKDLQINGDDLQSLGFKQGKQIGIILNKLLRLVIDEQLENEYSALAAKTKEWQISE